MSVTTLSIQPSNTTSIQTTSIANTDNPVYLNPTCGQQVPNHLLSSQNQLEAEKRNITAFVCDSDASSFYLLNFFNMSDGIIDGSLLSYSQYLTILSAGESFVPGGTVGGEYRSVKFKVPLDSEAQVECTEFFGNFGVYQVPETHKCKCNCDSTSSLFSELPFSSLGNSEFSSMLTTLSEAASSERVITSPTVFTSDMHNTFKTFSSTVTEFLKSTKVSTTEAPEVTKTSTPSESTPESSITTKVVTGGVSAALIGTFIGVGGLLALGTGAGLVGIGYFVKKYRMRTHELETGREEGISGDVQHSTETQESVT